MGAADPTYPLYPVACTIASMMLTLVLLTSFVRQRWNLGVSFLSFWLLVDTVTNAVNAVIWSDNSDIRLYAYCDIVSHTHVIAYIIVPMSTLITTRRLYLIASLQSVELPSKAAKRWDSAVEWTLGLVIPVLIAGPIYYINQGSRFRVIEGYGCTTADYDSIFELVSIDALIVIAPLTSIVFYYPTVARTYYRHRRDIHSFLRSDPSISRTNYLRILILASIDIFLTLPIGITNLTLDIWQASSEHFKFYPGWSFLHANWEPERVSYAEIKAEGIASFADTYVAQWTSPIIAFAVFGLFGWTPEARASYWHIICAIGGRLGWDRILRIHNQDASLGDIEFGVRPRDSSGIDLEVGSHPPSFIDSDDEVAATTVDMMYTGGRRTPPRQADADVELINEALSKATSRDIEVYDGTECEMMTARDEVRFALKQQTTTVASASLPHESTAG